MALKRIDKHVAVSSTTNYSNRMDNKGMQFIHERSPDLFSDDDDDEADGEPDTEATNDCEAAAIADVGIDSTAADSNSFGDKDAAPMSREQTEKAISKRIQDMLSGVLPPPSVTYIEYDCNSMLAMYKRNYVEMQDFIDGVNGKAAANDKLPAMPQKLDGAEWPETSQCDEYGLHFNRTKYTESIEMLYMRLAERNVGLETGSSFLSGISTNIRKKPPKKLLASPGNRLSHLARRRAIFSSANLLSQSEHLHASKLGRKPCVIDTSNRKLSRKEKVTTPKRRLFGRRTPGRKTPGSLRKSGRKAAASATKPNIASRETSKRALFLSPTQDKPAKESSVAPEITCRIEKSRRALFSPPRRLERSISNISALSNGSLGSSSHKMSQNLDGHSSELGRSSSCGDAAALCLKRKRESYNEENMEPLRSSKVPRYQSQSTVQSLSAAQTASLLPKAASESAMVPNQQLSASHKQKLLWAVSTALKKKSVTTGHEHFNHFAAVLAKVVKRLFLESTISKSESTSATMLKLADRLVFFVIQGKSVDEIYLEEKARLGAAKMASKRLSGYINRDEYLLHQSSASADAGGALNASSSAAGSGENERPSLTNSSSKSNVGTSVLRENHDSKSAQKTSYVSFSGRNQKNLSPYNDKSRSSCNQNQQTKLIGGAVSSIHSNIMKVKRQISFDS